MQTVIEYLDRAIEGFDRDPADSEFQRGYLEALKTVRAEAFQTPEGGFAKLFNTPHGQFLAYLDFDDDEGGCDYLIRTVGAEVRGVIPRAMLAYTTDEAQKRAFAKIDQAQAEASAEALFATADRFAQPEQAA